MKTSHDAYKLAEEIDNKISDHFGINPFNELSDRECLYWLLFIRTVQTTLDLLKTAIDSQRDKLKLENELSKQKT